MNGVIVYYSKWGNCKRIAESISRGLYETGHNVRLIEAKSHEGDLDNGVIEFILIGSPTRGGHMASPIKKFIKRCMSDSWEGKTFAAFGTGGKINAEQGKPQSATDIQRLLSEMGLKPAVPAFKAKVVAAKGPLDDGEAARATKFGKELGTLLNNS